jgi:hypothetical protein
MSPLSQRDRRALLLLGGAAAVFLVLQFGPLPGSEPAAVFAPSLELGEKRLRRLQEVARQKPRVAAETEAAARALAETEKGLLKGATAAQASAEMQQIMKDLLAGQGINLGASEFGAVKALGTDYAQVPLTVNFICAIEQWINLMSAIRNAPQVVSSLELRIVGADPAQKTVNVRMTVAGYIPASLVARAKEAAL